MATELREQATVMTVAEVAAFLRLAECTVYKLAQDGELPGRKVGGTWRFSRKGLEEWLVQPGANSPPEEPAQPAVPR